MSVLDDFTSDPVRHLLFLKEKAIVDFAELVCGLLLKKGITTAEFAKTLEMPEAGLMHYLDAGYYNPRMMAKMLFHLGYSLEVKAKPLKSLGVQ